MNKFKKLIPIILIGIMVIFTFTGCTGCINPFSLFFNKKESSVDDPGKYISSSNATKNTTDSTNNTTTVNSTPSGAISNSDLAGTWYCSSVSDGSQTYSPSEKGFYDCYLTLNNDGSFVLNICSTRWTGIYEAYNNSITLNMSNTSIFDHLDGTITGSTIKIKEAYDIGGQYFDFTFMK